MAYSITTPLIGAQPIAEVSATQRHPFGAIVQASDPTYGQGEFIYVKGVSSGFTGALVTYTANDGATALSTTSGVATGGAPMAVLMSALDAATKYGWAQIAGDAVMYKTAVKFDPASGNRVYLSGTAGRIMQTSVAGRQIIGARFVSAVTVTSTTSTAVITLNRPAQKTGSAV